MDITSSPPVLAFGLAQKAIVPPAQLLASAQMFAPPASLPAPCCSQLLSRESTRGSEGHKVLAQSLSPPAPVTPQATPSPAISQDAPSSRGAKWAERLCHTTFFGPCPHHSSKMYRRCECTHFCMDCDDSSALCTCCLSDHATCHTLQIRRYVYRDVVKVCDVQRFLDTTGIQTYTVNHAQAIFLSAKDKAQVGPYYRVDSSSSCITCHRGLRNGCQYCSLACKLAATEGIRPPEPSKEQRARAPKAAPKPVKAAPRPVRCVPGEESHSEDATQVHGLLTASGASTPTAAPRVVLHSVDLSLSPSVSQTLDRSAKRPSHSMAPTRRKQLRPMRAAE
eukprot:jgi/Ulvmu1/414/UM001_0421.1